VKVMEKALQGKSIGSRCETGDLLAEVGLFFWAKCLEQINCRGAGQGGEAAWNGHYLSISYITLHQPS